MQAKALLQKYSRYTAQVCRLSWKLWLFYAIGKELKQTMSSVLSQAHILTQADSSKAQYLLSRAESKSCFLLVAAMTTLRLLLSKPSRWRSKTPSKRRVASCISEPLQADTVPRSPDCTYCSAMYKALQQHTQFRPFDSRVQDTQDRLHVYRDTQDHQKVMIAGKFVKHQAATFCKDRTAAT